MRQVTLNIGLGNNPFDATTATKLLIGYGMTPKRAKIHTGEWNGQPERTLVVLVHMSDTATDQLIKQQVSFIADRMTQDAIAWKVTGRGHLTYNNSWRGERDVFNEQYFIDFNDAPKRHITSGGFQMRDGFIREMTEADREQQRVNLERMRQGK
jgi:hypothetical protein